VNRRFNIFDPSFSSVLEQKAGVTFELVADTPGNVYFTWLCETLQPSRNIDAVPVDVVLIDDHVTSVDANAEPDTPIAGNGGVMIDQRVLDIEPAAYRGYCAIKLDQEGIALGPDQTTALLLDSWLNYVLRIIRKRHMGLFFVNAHKPTIPNHVREQDSSKSPL
jgi:hypothetical protein